MIYSYEGIIPKIDEDCFIAQNSSLIGNVEMKKGSSLWFGAVVRGDSDKIIIGKNTNIQDNCTLHSDKGIPTIIGDNVTVGHNCVVHGCTINNNCIIGMGSIILNGAEIGENCIIGAGSLITQNTKIPSNSLCFGAPVRVIRELTEDEIKSIKESAKHYVEYSRKYI